MQIANPSEFKVAIVGAGNVATRIGISLKKLDFDIVCVASRTIASASHLAGILGCEAVNDVSLIPADCDLVLIASTDAAVAEIASKLPEIKGVVAHTSGSVPLSAIACKHRRAAVIYPLQTFSREVEVDISTVPFFTEATDDTSLAVADAFAHKLSDTCEHADSAIRAKLHIAGVLSSNFPIYLLEMTQKVLESANLPLSTVAPLVKASMDKAFKAGPHNAITGPARRGDMAVLKRHIESLAEPDDKAIYKAISNAILKEFHENLQL